MHLLKKKLFSLSLEKQHMPPSLFPYKIRFLCRHLNYFINIKFTLTWFYFKERRVCCHNSRTAVYVNANGVPAFRPNDTFPPKARRGACLYVNLCFSRRIIVTINYQFDFPPDGKRRWESYEKFTNSLGLFKIILISVSGSIGDSRTKSADWKKTLHNKNRIYNLHFYGFY